VIYRFHPGAQAEHLQTIRFYESRSQGLGGDDLREFEALMQRVLSRPHRYRIERKPDIRRASLLRFPHKVIYRERFDSVEVLAVAHHRQRPGYWTQGI